MEQNVKKRGWVKNAAIIFLSVMLVLTFFSNTIMNRSLPEVATQYVTNGAISTRVRGTGTVTANENYEVLLDQSREVQSVLVKVGQEVNVGDVLMILAEGDSDELAAAQESLRKLNMDYQRALITATDTDYAQQNRDIEIYRKELSEAQEKRDRLVVTDAEYDKATADVAAAKKGVTTAQSAVDKAQDALNAIGGQSSGDSSAANSVYNQMEAKRKEIDEAKNALETAKLMYGTYYDEMKKTATDQIKATTEYSVLTSEADQKAFIEKKLPIYMPAIAEQYKDAKDDNLVYYTAYSSITECEETISDLEAQYDELSDQYYTLINQDNSYEYSKCKKALTEAQNALTDAQELLTTRQEALDTLKTNKADYEAAVTTAETCQKNLEDAIFAFEEKQKEDGKTQKLEALDRQDLAAQIATQKALVEKLSGGSTDSEIKSKVSGIVQSIAVTAGHTAAADTALITIEVPDLGYGLSFSVTNDQARKVRTGDTASVSNYYYGSQIDAVLTSIKTDPQNPQTNKLLVFDLSGDVTAGASLTLSVGQKSADYDYVVPNSAIRSDSNGSFVLIITAKNSPLGNRYIATRVDVQVLASDDTSSAVTGALNSYDYVITTSTKPISAGDQVKMADALQ